MEKDPFTWVTDNLDCPGKEEGNSAGQFLVLFRKAVPQKFQKCQQQALLWQMMSTLYMSIKVGQSQKGKFSHSCLMAAQGGKDQTKAVVVDEWTNLNNMFCKNR